MDLCGGVTVWVGVMWTFGEQVSTAGCYVNLLTVGNCMGR
jgi:hypothetical protein